MASAWSWSPSTGSGLPSSDTSASAISSWHLPLPSLPAEWLRGRQVAPERSVDMSRRPGPNRWPGHQFPPRRSMAAGLPVTRSAKVVPIQRNRNAQGRLERECHQVSEAEAVGNSLGQCLGIVLARILNVALVVDGRPRESTCASHRPMSTPKMYIGAR